MATVGNLFVNITANTSQFERGLMKTRAMLKSFDASAATVKLFGFTSAITAAGTALAGLYLRSQAEAIDRNYKIASSLGVATEAFGGLSYAASLSGVDSEQFGAAMQRLARMTGDAANGSKTAIDAFARVGISLSDLKGMAPDQVFMKTADAIKAMESPAEAASAGFGLLGRSGAAMMPFLQTGSESMRALSKEAQDLGAVVDNVGSARVEAMNDSIDRMRAILRSAANTVLVEVSPYIRQLGDDLVASSTATSGFGATIKEVFDAAIPAIAFAADVVRGLGVAWDFLAATAKLGWSLMAEGISGILRVIDAATFGAAGLSEWADKLHESSESLFAGAGKSWNEMKTGFRALASNPVADLADRAKKSQDALDAVVASAQETKAAITKTADISEATDAASKLSERLYEQALTFGMTGRAAEIYLAKLDGADETFIKYLEYIDGVLTKKEQEKEAFEKTEAMVESARKTHADLVAGLEEQIATFGMSASAVDLYRASLRNAGDEEMRQLKTLHDVLDAKQRMADLLAEGDQLMKSLMTPQEQYADSLKRIQELLDAGAITSETFRRATSKAAEEFASAGGMNFERPDSIGIETVLGNIKLPGILDGIDVQNQILTQAQRHTELLTEISGMGDRTGTIRALDNAMPAGLVRVIDEAVVAEVKKSNVHLEALVKNTAAFAGALT